jgi:hypothetical protein
MQITRHRVAFTAVSIASLVGLGLAGNAVADDDHSTKLKGYEEVPAVSSTGKGRFKAKIDKASNSLHYEISYSGLEGEVRQAHIHFGQRGVNGGITLWLCQTPQNPSPTPTTTPACPQAGTVTGVLTSADVIGPAGQGIAAGEFAEVLAAIRAGAAYVNVHTSKHGGGEIRGQLRDED